MSLAAMKQALAALENSQSYVEFDWVKNQCGRAITALRAAIEQTNDWDEVEALRASLREHMAEIQRLRDAIEQAQEPETELETYKRLYELRGKALERPCSNCGHQPAKIKAMAQPKQEPVWIQPNHLQKARQAPFLCRVEPKQRDDFVPLYTTPRQWQGLTDDEIVLICGECAASHADDISYARAIEAKLREKNT